uniref:Ankyrin repeat-containing protein n=1 Tax=Vitis vinifera TaxID=29760 RepID=F6GWI0_VITVI
MDQLGASNHGAELQDCRISNQAANADGRQTVITGMDAGLYKAAAEGKIDDLKKISEHEFQVQLTPNHNTILHIAAQFGKLDCVQWILTLPFMFLSTATAKSERRDSASPCSKGRAFEGRGSSYTHCKITSRRY